MKDVVDPVLDERLATFVVDSHFKSHPTEKANHGPSVPIETEISQEMLRKYITYSKQFCRPKLKHADADKISRVYADLRREFVTGQVKMLTPLLVCDGFLSTTKECVYLTQPPQTRHWSTVVRWNR